MKTLKKENFARFFWKKNFREIFIFPGVKFGKGPQRTFGRWKAKYPDTSTDILCQTVDFPKQKWENNEILKFDLKKNGQILRIFFENFRFFCYKLALESTESTSDRAKNQNHEFF
jgi:hypothetical protein